MIYGVPVHAVETEVLSDNSFAEFNQGVSTGTELLAAGRLQIGPRAVLKERSGEGIVWKIAVDKKDGTVYYATGHNGKVFRLESGDDTPELWADLTEVQATAIVADPHGGVLVGASPGGKIYKIAKKGKPELYYETREKYVWDMAFDTSGTLFAATGTSGKIIQITGSQKGELLFDSDATNVMSLGFDKDGKLLAATQGKGYVIRIDGPKSAYVLYAASQDEVRSLAVDAIGNIYAAANSVRVSSLLDKPTTSTTGFGSALDGAGELVQIQPSGYAASFWNAPEGPIHCILADETTSNILVAAGKNGKIYRVQPSDSEYSVIADLDESMATALANSPGGVLLGTANKAVIYQMETTASQVAGTFASRALNAKTTVQWGNLIYDGEMTSGSKIAIDTRSGNTPEPSDGTWSPWITAEPVAPQIVKTKSPVAQYLQYRVTFPAEAGGEGNFLDSIKVYYVQKNAAPVIKKIAVDKVPGSPAAAQAAALMAAAARMQQSSSSADSDKAKEAGNEAAKAASAAAQAAQAAIAAKAAQAGSDMQNSQKLNIAWQAEDPNGDKLRYELSYKGEDESVWKSVEENLTTNRHQFSTEAIPDGQYRFRVEATDRFDNPETSASTVSLVSRIYTVDNSAPEIADFKATAAAPGEYVVTATASDKTSIIAAGEYNLDAAEEWRSLTPDDGIFGSEPGNFYPAY